MSTAIERINLRATREAKQVIEQAAALTGTTLSAFMLQHAYEKALNLIEQQQRITLNAADWERLNQALENPAEANEELKALMALGEQLV
ncbi:MULTISPECIES: DUF1778 domain-containing protein [Acinetobacter]|nr:MULTISPECIES: DUF1778 domain-containing protein [Acinetobacter]MEC8058345.1 DUF1778 domain-containing protein [Pseudomonadota bacterium]ENX50048.1 hypothetical protein F943_00657 [Acinetobacter ursingii NIPH 706]EXD32960.1 hypothetical protein J500_2890 [Acinetobacter sp. 479375]MCH2016345.1 DUF1778 domain-containing protein [Acinetobacter ursingii]UYF71154.1 DUF1778 domain-containing protein [Acinetobacter ursingii]